jgi:gliding motility-associated lipoprotein GldH
MDRNIHVACVLCLLFCVLCSCAKDTVYNQYAVIEDYAWDKKTEYFFNFKITDNAIPYNISLNLRNNNLYPFKNLWLFYDIKLPDGSLVNDTLEVILADDFGKWTGKGISIYHNEFRLQTAYLFPDTGQYMIVFRQGMRENLLKGIENIGLMIETAARKRR